MEQPVLRINDDGTITIPLDGREPVVLRYPNMVKMARLTVLATEADAELTELDPIDPEHATFDQRQSFADQVNARTTEIFGDKSPHGQRMITVIEMLSGETVTEDELYAWAMSPRCLRTILEHFRSPLPGPESPET